MKNAVRWIWWCFSIVTRMCCFILCALDFNYLPLNIIFTRPERQKECGMSRMGRKKARQQKGFKIRVINIRSFVNNVFLFLLLFCVIKVTNWMETVIGSAQVVCWLSDKEDLHLDVCGQLKERKHPFPRWWINRLSIKIYKLSHLYQDLFSIVRPPSIILWILFLRVINPFFSKKLFRPPSTPRRRHHVCEMRLICRSDWQLIFSLFP